jgi:hypothetical protein
MPKTQDRLSLDEFMIPVQVIIPEGGNADPTTDVVQFQFVNGGLPARSHPTEGGWVDGFWITRAAGTILACVLVGPGGAVELDPGTWAAWMRVVDNPTVPVAPVDVLTIT